MAMSSISLSGSTFELAHRPKDFSGPELDRSVETAARQAHAGRREGDGADRVQVPLQADALLAGPQVPQADQAVLSAGSEEPPVGGERHAARALRVAGQSGFQFVVARVPQENARSLL